MLQQVGFECGETDHWRAAIAEWTQPRVSTKNETIGRSLIDQFHDLSR